MHFKIKLITIVFLLAITVVVFVSYHYRDKHSRMNSEHERLNIAQQAHDAWSRSYYFPNHVSPSDWRNGSAALRQFILTHPLAKERAELEAAAKAGLLKGPLDIDYVFAKALRDELYISASEYGDEEYLIHLLQHLPTDYIGAMPSEYRIGLDLGIRGLGILVQAAEMASDPQTKNLLISLLRRAMKEVCAPEDSINDCISNTRAWISAHLHVAEINSNYMDMSQQYPEDADRWPALFLVH